MRSDIIDITATVCAETDAAYKVETEASTPNRAWVPKSQVEWEPRTVSGRPTRTGTLSLPRWLAEERELV